MTWKRGSKVESDKILEIINVGMKYHTLQGETTAISGLNFNVYKEEFITIVGPSGCGKSTVLSLISGLIKPSEGSININISDSEKYIQKVGYMLQRDYLFEWRTIEQNVLLGLELKHALTEESKSYALELTKKYGLGEFLQHYPSQLSGGMRQKAALIRTLAVKPQILLLDEPFSALDYQTRINISEEILNIIKNEKKTAVLVSHDISEAVSLSDRVVIFSSRPSKVKKIINIDFGSDKLSLHEKRNHKNFNNYFDTVWSELVE